MYIGLSLDAAGVIMFFLWMSSVWLKRNWLTACATALAWSGQDPVSVQSGPAIFTRLDILSRQTWQALTRLHNCAV